MTISHTLPRNRPMPTSRSQPRLGLLIVASALLWVLQAGLAHAANIDLLVVLDRNGTDFTLQQTISMDSARPTDGQPAADNPTQISAKISLEPDIKDLEFLFLGPDQQTYRDLYSNGAALPTVISISSGSVIIRYRHTVKNKIEPSENNTFTFLLSQILLDTRFSEESQVIHSATLMLPEELEFAFADEDSVHASNTGRTISIRTSEKEAFALPIRFRHVDQDQDGIADADDLCANSPDVALVDRTGCEPDADIDGITDIIDMCPGSTVGVTVDDKGCEADADNDGLADRYDQCDDTPANYAIGDNGCSLDTDKDGVVNGEDQCPDSEPFEPVSRRGCSLDFDNDGIPNFRDQCNASPRGRAVNANGCEIDTDSDGTPNRLDVCVDTPANIEVDKSGCPFDQDGDQVPDYRDVCLTDSDIVTDSVIAGSAIEPINNSTRGKLGCVETVVTKNVEATTGSENGALDVNDNIVVLSGIKFTIGSTLLSVESRQVLNRVARAISHHRTAKFEVGAHTDNIGEPLFNLQLSQERADAVRQYLMVRGVSPNTITAQGYGESLPISNNRSEESREQNRRVELRKLNE